MKISRDSGTPSEIPPTRFLAPPGLSFLTPSSIFPLSHQAPARRKIVSSALAEFRLISTLETVLDNVANVPLLENLSSFALFYHELCAELPSLVMFSYILYFILTFIIR